MADRDAKDALFDGLVTAARALSSGRRAEIVDLLSQGERPVEEIATEIGQSVANTSQHLQQLLRAGLVHARRQGNRVYYDLSDDGVAELWSMLRSVAARHVSNFEELATDYLGDRRQLRTITRAELNRRLRHHDVVVLDVRPTPEYRAGHIRGAYSAPIDGLQDLLPDLAPDVDVIAYCRGPYCAYADQAVRQLIKNGRRAARLEDGYPEWARAGLPVTSL
jgi:rhodanese-related sulfurtransferase